ncbi:hypothetical protein ACSFBM_33850 [Variovorax sp. GB1R11]|uniref:hypothetical protein n=1 Tax=Variovorax sp. GB1R11 TaxID=3443741 RepID=UPI003F47291A
MSWDEAAPTYRPCPCGAGKYAVISRFDDWNRSDERWEMHCPACATKYDLYVRNYTGRKGMAATFRGWVLRNLLGELAAASAKLNDAKQSLATFASAQLGDHWLAYFAGRTKKAIWSELTEGGKCYPSLQAFYTQTRNSSPERILKEYFSYRRLPTVVRILGLSPESELAQRLKQTEYLESELKEMDCKVREHAIG